KARQEGLVRLLKMTFMRSSNADIAACDPTPSTFYERSPRWIPRQRELRGFIQLNTLYHSQSKITPITPCLPSEPSSNQSLSSPDSERTIFSSLPIYQ